MSVVFVIHPCRYPGDGLISRSVLSVGHPLFMSVFEGLYTYNEIYFVVHSLFLFPLWVILSFCLN